MNILENIRKGKYTPEFTSVQLKGDNSNLVKELIYKNSVQKAIEVNDNTIVETLKNLRQNPDYNITIRDRANLLGFTKNLKDNIVKTKEKIKDIKDNFIRDIRNANDKYTFNFSNRPDLIKYATNVFQERKDSISADDFLTLIELKKQIEMDQLTKYKEENP